jgi:hypothetical protein
MAKVMDLINERFGRLVVVRREENSRAGKSRWLCICDCGNEKVVVGGNLKHRGQQSCGCLRDEVTIRRNFKHGMMSHPLYGTWKNMRGRCNSPDHKNFEHYGGRGIKICPRWDDFILFVKDMGERPHPKYSLERINNDKDYSPENCKWATHTEQRNNTRVNKIITFLGVDYTIAQAAKIFSMKYQKLYSRLRRGWSVYDAITVL